MNQIKKWLAGLSLTILTVIVALALTLYCALPDLCENEQLSASTSPNEEYEAVTFRRNCGATTSYSVQVSVIPSGGELPNESGNVVVFREYLVPGIRWSTPRELEVSYPSHADAGRVDKMTNDVSVVYSPVTE